ncbi:MAG: polysaccharide biosynthesis protein [Porphyromonadaceae bacterium CG2_30_38_12]|nr:MAG: polysaccharide biosynthesis protein [Porphyromonadaceae bacterium CG2_30_38_12]
MAVNQLKAGALLSYVLIGLGSLISIVYTPIMLRLLGQSEYGLYNLVASVVAYLGLFNFGFGSAYIKYFSVYKAQHDEPAIARLNGMFLLIFSALGMVAILAGIVLVYFTDSIFGTSLSLYELAKAKILMAIMVANFAITFPSIVFNSYVTASEKFIFQKILLIAKTIFNPFVIIPVLLIGYGSIGLVIATTIISLLVELINLRFAYKKARIQFLFTKFDFKLLRELFVFSSFIFMNLVVNQINWNVDRFIIGRFRGTVEVAIYSIAAQLNTYYLSLSTAMSGVYIPRVNEMIARKCSNWELSELFARLGRLQFIVLGFIVTALLFFGFAFITMWAGKDYSSAYPMALLLIIPVTIPLIQNLGIEIQRAKNQHKFRSWVYLFIAIGNVLISIPLVKLYGGVGAALGTAIALFVGNVLIMNWYYHKKVGLNIIYFSKQIVLLLPAMLIPAAAGYFILRDVNLIQITNFILFACLYFILYFVSMWFFGFNDYEKELITKPFIKMKSKLTNNR